MTTRVLNRVIYDLFASDADQVVLARAGMRHELDREIRLEFDQGGDLYLSWTWIPSGEENGSVYVLGLRDTSWFNPPAELSVDASVFPHWEAIVGSRVELVFIDDTLQVVRIGTDDAAVFCSALDHDTVTVASEPPC